MTRNELAEIVYNRHGGISKKEASQLLNLILEAIKTHIASGERVEITGFGAFEVTRKKGRRGRNPLTGESISIPEKKTLSFKPSKLLKKDLNR